MIVKNQLDKSFVPVGTSAGLIMFVVGLVTTYSSFYGLILILLGAFVGFSSTGTFIDLDKRKIKFSNNLFGIIQTGKWLQIEPTMKIGIQESNVTWRTHSSGDRTLDIAENDFRIILFDSENQEIMQIKKTGSLDAAQEEMNALCLQLGLDAI